MANIDEFNTLNTGIADLLECPVCREVCRPPIRACVMSHLICSYCFTKVSKCPTCRSDLSEHPFPFAERMSALVAMPCQNADEGCLRSATLGAIEQHEEYCEYRTYECLVGRDLFAKVPHGGCRWRGPYDQLLEHVRDTHPKCLSYKPATKYRVNVDKVSVFVRLISVHDQLFWLTSKTWSSRRQMEFAVMQVTSSKLAADAYGVNLKVNNRNRRGCASTSQPVFPLPLRLEKVKLYARRLDNHIIRSLLSWQMVTFHVYVYKE